MPLQIILGFCLSIRYFHNSLDLFENSFFVYYNLNWGWMLRFMHSNLTSVIFIFLFIHILRRLIYKNIIRKKMWLSGMFMIIILIAVSFLGYSLINSQISYWASIVITNFISTIPIVGNDLLLLIWGNRFIDSTLLNRFFSLHFILALLIVLISLVHLYILHLGKSFNPLNLNNNLDQLNLQPGLIVKDFLLLFLIFYFFILINVFYPYYMNNPDNFNPMIVFKTPNHIEPEWYFLFFYSILRSVNDKFVGLIIIAFSIFILFWLPNIIIRKYISNKFVFINKLLIYIIISNIIIVTFLGSKPSKIPYIIVLKYLIIIYFVLFLLVTFINSLINKM